MKTKFQSRVTFRLAGTKVIYAILLLALSLAAPFAHAAALPGIPEFIDEMVAKHQFKRAELERVFARAQHLPNVIETISRPATTKPWLEYRAAFVNAERIKSGLKFWNKYRQTLQKAEQKYGVPQEIILAVIGVETVYGQDAGTFRTLDALTTLAFDYPRRAGFFRNELENYLLLAREQQLNLLEIRGSYAGALGIPQFMPSSYRNFAVDFNGNHRIDLLREARDAIGSVANYLQSYGWDPGIPPKNPSTKLRTGFWPGTRETGNPQPYEGGVQLKPPIAVPALVVEKDRVGQAGEQNSLGETAAPRTLAAWSVAGVVPGANIAQAEEPFDPSTRLRTGFAQDRLLAGYPDETARLIDFTVAEGREFWLVFNNFEVIARYNNSDFYAMSVFQLAEAIKAARKAAALQAITSK